MKDIIEAQDEYINLLSEAIDETFGILIAHGMYPDKEKVEKGKQLREKIANLKQKNHE